MNNINYALAPAGSTHYDIFDGDFYFLKKTPSGKSWRYFHNTHNEWCDCDDGEEPTNYYPIPESEQALNRLADNCALWTIPANARATVSTKGHFGWMWPEDATEGYFTKEQWQYRRAERIGLGLIKVDNPITSSLTDSQAKEMELDILNQNNDLADVNYTDVVEWINGIPPMGTKCEYRRKMWADEDLYDTCDFIGAHPSGMVVLFFHGSYIPIKPDEVEFRPLKTAEQIAAEKREEWVEAASRKFRSSCVVDYSGQPFIDGLSAIYDALLSGELEAPKGGDV